MKKNSISITIIFLLFFVIKLFPQSSFEINYDSNKSESFFYAFDDSNGNSFSIGGVGENYGVYPYNAFIVKIDVNGNIMKEKVIIKQDTSFSFFYGFQKENGNYFLSGILSYTNVPKHDNCLYFCELDTNLEIVWEKIFELPEPFKHYRPNDSFIDSNTIVMEGMADTSAQSYNDFLSLFRVNFQGDVVDWKIYYDWEDMGLTSTFMFNYDSAGYVLYGDGAHNFSVREWIEINKEFEITSWVPIIDNEYMALTPLSAVWLPNGNLFSANMTSEGYNTYVKVMDQQLNTLHDTVLDYNETTYVITFKGLDYTDPENIWLGTFVGMPVYFAGTEVFRIHIFDSNGHLKGLKVYGGENRYWFYNLNSTSDGGCILTGEINEKEGEYNTNGYVIKVMPDDILTNAEETPCKFDRDVSVYPNPFNNYINFETMRNNLRMSLYDNSGKPITENKALTIPFSQLQTGNLKPGFYFYTITEKNRIIQSGKLIKQ